jgi:hypothetical protein
MIVGLAGKKGSGKSSLAKMLIDKNKYYRYSFADPIKKMVRSMLDDYDIDFDSIEIDKDSFIEPCRNSYRHILQTLGTEWGRKLLCHDIWIKLMSKRLDYDHENIVIDDVRFQNEAEMIRDRGGLIIYISREYSYSIDRHESEINFIPSKNDAKIENNGNLENLYERAFSAIISHMDRRA